MYPEITAKNLTIMAYQPNWIDGVLSIRPKVSQCFQGAYFMSLEDLRRKALAEDDDDPFADSGIALQDESEDLIFGLNSVERMFLSIGLFLVISIFSFLILLMAGSIEIP
jgi:hypothetical protein